MKKTIIAFSAALLIASSLFVSAGPASDSKVAAVNKECCQPNDNCVCVPTPDGECVCIPTGAAITEAEVTEQNSRCPSTADCVCD